MKRLGWLWLFVLVGIHLGSCRLGESLDAFTSEGMAATGQSEAAGMSGAGTDSGTGGSAGGESGMAGAISGSGGTEAEIGGNSGTGGGEGGIAGGGTGGREGGIAGSSGTAGSPTACGALEELGKDGYCVAKLVSMPGYYSIDATQVTRAQYETWLDTIPSITGQPSFCEWNVNFEPSCQWQSGVKKNHPAVCVDWCDAYAYCQAVGKRLCGKIGGGENQFTDFADASKSQWYVACSSGGNSTYPYGDTYDAQACNGNDMGLGTTSEVGSLPTCQSMVSPYEGVYDLSGNVWEWEDSCHANTGASDSCRLRGGSCDYEANALRCSHGFDLIRDFQSPSVGFRCCSSP